MRNILLEFFLSWRLILFGENKKVYFFLLFFFFAGKVRVRVPAYYFPVSFKFSFVSLPPPAGHTRTHAHAIRSGQVRSR